MLWKCRKSRMKWEDLPRLGSYIIKEEEQRLLRSELKTLTNNPHKLSYCYIIGHKEFMLIEIIDLRIWMFLNNHLFKQGNDIDKNDEKWSKNQKV